MLDSRIPILIVTGFLGSGKTTFINNLLATMDNKRIAIIENEFAELGIDVNLIKKKDKDSTVFELNNGCICCTINGELDGVFKDLSDNKEDWDYIILETTGVADPSPIISNFISNPLISLDFRLDSVYTIVDGKNFPKQMKKKFEVKKQIAFANRIILNKIDLISEEERNEIKETIKKINPESNIIETTHSKINLENVFNEKSFEIQKPEDIKNSFSSFLFAGPENQNTNFVQKNQHDHDHKHTENIDSFGISFKEELSLSKFDFFIRTLVHVKGDDLYRFKGIVNIEGSGQPIIFQGVHDAIDYFPGPPWENEEERETKFVFIGENLNEEEIRASIKRLIAIEE